MEVAMSEKTNLVWIDGCTVVNMAHVSSIRFVNDRTVCLNMVGDTSTWGTFTLRDNNASDFIAWLKKNSTIIGTTGGDHGI